MGKRFIAVYGSLREGDYNYERFKAIFKDDFKKITEPIEIKGYRLFDLGSYPGIVESTDNHKLTIEIIQCSQECYNTILTMEVNAGYKVSEIHVNDNGVMYDCSIFIYQGNRTNCPIVDNGDWISYINEEAKI